jgi:hypothetical protein
MILSTHAIVGGAIASLFPSHPLLVVAAGFASHFAIDAIPHRDYHLQAISVSPTAERRALNLDRRLWLDLTLIALDAGAGLAIAIWLFAPPATIGAILLGALAAMVPDPLQVVHAVYPREPLKSLQRFHQWIHTKRKMSWPLGATSQAIFAATVSAIAIVLG